jgi:hypothetical protein
VRDGLEGEPVDEVMIGRTGEPFTIVIETGKIREFARATKSRNPAYFGDEGATTPATFLISSLLWQGPGSNPLRERNYARLLHGEQEFVFHGEPPRAGTKLTGQSRIDKLYEKEGRRGGTMEFTEIVTEFKDGSGRVVAESRSTTIVTSKAAGERA